MCMSLYRSTLHALPYATPRRAAPGCWSLRRVSAHAATQPVDDSDSSDSENAEPATRCLPFKIGVIGAGQMSRAIINGWLSSGTSTPGQICTSNRSAAARKQLSDMGLVTFGSAAPFGSAKVANFSDIIMLGVKPQNMEDVLVTAAPHIRPHHLVISIAAGLKLSFYESHLPAGTKVVRVMPNTPVLVGIGASAYSMGRYTTAEDEQVVRELFGGSGMVMGVEEKLMDAVTGLSGSGPAYAYLMIEAMADGGVMAGLPREQALQLAAQTVAGAAAMVLQGGEQGGPCHPAILKDRVCSPGGATIAAMLELEQGGARAAFVKAVMASANRSKEMSSS